MSGFITYWAKEHISNLRKNNDNGPLSVIFGSQHQKMPSISKVKKGDIIYPVTLLDGNLYIMARMPVENVESAFEYLIRETGSYCSALIPDDTAMVGEDGVNGKFAILSKGRVLKDGEPFPKEITRTFELKASDISHKFHQHPQTCCADLAATSTTGSFIVKRIVPAELIPEMSFCSVKGKEKPLKLDKNGVPTINALSGFVRRMSDNTQAVFEMLFADDTQSN